MFAATHCPQICHSAHGQIQDVTEGGLFWQSPEIVRPHPLITSHAQLKLPNVTSLEGQNKF